MAEQEPSVSRPIWGPKTCPNHPDTPSASPSSNLCGPCLMGRPVNDPTKAAEARKHGNGWLDPAKGYGGAK